MVCRQSGLEKCQCDAQLIMFADGKTLQDMARLVNK